MKPSVEKWLASHSSITPDAVILEQCLDDSNEPVSFDLMDLESAGLRCMFREKEECNLEDCGSH